MQPGALFDGRYRVVREIGRGGMGIVLEAVDERDSLSTLGSEARTRRRRVAIKLMLPELASDETLRLRFLREGQVLLSLKSMHTLRALECGELKADGRTPFLITELLTGRTLDEEMATDGLASVERVCTWMRQAAMSLAEAHSLALIHRDIKPANLFLATIDDSADVDTETILKVIDFGIAKDIDALPAHALTRTGEGLGSPGYMSPEQIRGSSLSALALSSSSSFVSPATDIWSLGVTMFELLTGELPFDGASVAKIFRDILQATAPPRVQSRRSGVPSAVDNIVARCLDADPKGRPTAAELVDLLAPFSVGAENTDRARVTARPAPGAAHEKPDALANTLDASSRQRSVGQQQRKRQRQRPRTHPLFIFAISVVSVLFVGGLASSRWLFRAHDNTNAPPSPSSLPPLAPVSASAVPIPIPPEPARLEPPSVVDASARGSVVRALEFHMTPIDSRSNIPAMPTPSKKERDAVLECAKQAGCLPNSVVDVTIYGGSSTGYTLASESSASCSKAHHCVQTEVMTWPRGKCSQSPTGPIETAGCSRTIRFTF